MITKDMMINEVVSKSPDSIRIFYEHGLYCVGCMASMFENIEQGAIAHGISVEDLLNDLNHLKSRQD